LSAAQKSAVEGWAKTWYALDLLYLIQTRDTIGVPTEIPATPSTPSPFVARAAVYQRIIATLDTAKTKLAAGGAAFVRDAPGIRGFRRASELPAVQPCDRPRPTCCTDRSAAAIRATRRRRGAQRVVHFEHGVDKLTRGVPHLLHRDGRRTNINSFVQQNYVYAKQAVTSRRSRPTCTRRSRAASW
jgi:hypothetical protein